MSPAYTVNIIVNDPVSPAGTLGLVYINLRLKRRVHEPVSPVIIVSLVYMNL